MTGIQPEVKDIVRSGLFRADERLAAGHVATERYVPVLQERRKHVGETGWCRGLVTHERVELSLNDPCRLPSGDTPALGRRWWLGPLVALGGLHGTVAVLHFRWATCRVLTGREPRVPPLNTHIGNLCIPREDIMHVVVAVVHHGDWQPVPVAVQVRIHDEIIPAPWRAMEMVPVDDVEEACAEPRVVLIQPLFLRGRLEAAEPIAIRAPRVFRDVLFQVQKQLNFLAFQDNRDPPRWVQCEEVGLAGKGELGLGDLWEAGVDHVEEFNWYCRQDSTGLPENRPGFGSGHAGDVGCSVESCNRRRVAGWQSRRGTMKEQAGV